MPVPLPGLFSLRLIQAWALDTGPEVPSDVSGQPVLQGKSPQPFPTLAAGVGTPPPEISHQIAEGALGVRAVLPCGWLLSQGRWEQPRECAERASAARPLVRAQGEKLVLETAGDCCRPLSTGHEPLLCRARGRAAPPAAWGHC